MSGTSLSAVWPVGKLRGGHGRQGWNTSSWSFGHFWAPWFGFWGAGKISQDCDEHLKPITLKFSGLVFFFFFFMVALQAVEWVPFARSKTVIGKINCVSMRKNRKVFLCLPLFGLRKYHPGQNSKSALLFYKLVTRVWKDRCRLYANRQCPRFLSASRARSTEK